MNKRASPGLEREPLLTLRDNSLSRNLLSTTRQVPDPAAGRCASIPLYILPLHPVPIYRKSTKGALLHPSQTMSRAASRLDGPSQTPRRSTRISQSVASRSVVSVSEAGTSATPGGKAKSTLPRLKSRQSTAYGASGRVGDAEELQIPVTGFSQAFQVQRDAAMARKEPLMSGALASDQDEHSPTPASSDAGTPSQQDYESEDPPTDDDDNNDDQQREDPSIEDSSIANTTKSFGMLRESGMMSTSNSVRYRSGALRAAPQTPVLPPRRPEPRPAFVQPRSVSKAPIRPQNGSPFIQPQPNVRPQTHAANPAASIPVEAEQVPKAGDSGIWAWLSKFLYSPKFLFTLLFAVLIVYITGTPNYKWDVSKLRRAVNEMTWVPPLHKHDRTYDDMFTWLKTRDNDWSERVRDMRIKVDGVSETLARLEPQLPDILVVTMQPDGSVQIGDEFWRALEGRMRREGFQSTSDVDWETFLRNNAEKLEAVFRKSYDASKPHPHALSRQQVTDLLDENWRKMSAHVDKRMEEVTKTINKQAKMAVVKEAKQSYADQIRLQSLAMTNLVANLELSLKKANYFARGLGATINPDLTSPTKTKGNAWLANTYGRLMVLPERQPPSSALEKWDEAGDSWCAPPDAQRDGKVQLGVNLLSPIFPDQITIEHIPMTAVPAKNIASAPKNVELWVKSDEPARPRYGSSDICRGNGLPGWVCLGSVQYDIFGANHIQTFDLQAESPVSIDRAIVRIVDNWGADHTCLYRVRLHGAFDGPDHNYDAIE
ncbi:unnamed protein product [Periconia digitata]|uniref:SUN domain-containing protein n=1 Tax=Periconia digitata TaxID=1303443 RepID=A0A9W4XQF8_9PLEO|nr:unnamed protein product [Periconia digitata]